MDRNKRRQAEDQPNDEKKLADDVDGWTDEPGDPDQAGPPAEFLDDPRPG